MDTSLPYQINDNQVLGNYIGVSPYGVYSSAYAVGKCFPGCEANDNGQGINIIDGSNRTIVDGNYINSLRSGVAINSPVSKGNIVRNNFIGIGSERRRRQHQPLRRLAQLADAAEHRRQQQDREHRMGRHRPRRQPSVYDNLISMNTFKNVGYPGDRHVPDEAGQHQRHAAPRRRSRRRSIP